MKKQAQQQQEWQVMVRNLWQHYATFLLPPSHILQVSAEAWEVETKCSYFSSFISPFFSFSPVTVTDFRVKWNS
jgi:hypothetical protein